MEDRQGVPTQGRRGFALLFRPQARLVQRLCAECACGVGSYLALSPHPPRGVVQSMNSSHTHLRSDPSVIPDD